MHEVFNIFLTTGETMSLQINEERTKLMITLSLGHRRQQENYTLDNYNFEAVDEI